MKTVALVTAATARDLDEDLAPLASALAGLGLEPAVVPWDDPRVAWRDYAAAVVRSTWDYAPRRDAFVAWAEATGEVVRLLNPAPVLRWNTDKRYLADLADRGIPVVPTRWIVPGQPIVLPGDGAPFVVKPAISAGAWDTARYAPGEEARAHDHAARLLAEGRTAMVQPYLERVDTSGETGLVYVDGAFSHAIRKGAILRPGTRVVGGLYAEERIEARVPTAEERALAERVLSLLPDLVPAAPEPPLYARVDLIPSECGPVLLELELTEPSLFHALGPGSVDRLARAIGGRVG